MEVSVLALGTWAMGGGFDGWGPVDDGECIAAINHALDSGVNLIDTAPIYGHGHSEEIVGNAVQGRRHEVVLATKCGLLLPARGVDVPPRCLEPESLLRECDASLRRLRTDVIDVYQCHWPDPNVPIRDTMAAMAKLLELGKIRIVGVSNFSFEQVSAAREFVDIQVLQAPFSMLLRRAADDLIPACAEYGMGVLSYSPLSKGLLTGKFSAESKFSGVRARDPDFVGKRFRRNLSVVDSLRRVSDRYGKTLAQLALNWTANYPGVTAPIFGAKRPSQVTENVGAAGWSISAEDRAEIDIILGESERHG